MRIASRRHLMALKVGSLLMLAVYVASSAEGVVEDAPVVRTTAGDIVGKRLRANGRDVDAYLGIPYGQPPVGERRFMKPLPAAPWSGVFRADTMNPGCVQTDFVVTEDVKIDASNTVEDCLRLNVWRPRGDCDGKSENATTTSSC